MSTPEVKPKPETAQKTKEDKYEKGLENILKDKKSFYKWFWQGKNSDDLIKAINDHPEEHGDYEHIRKEKASYRPQIYCVVLNYTFFDDDGWRFCKVGSTRGVQFDRVKQVEDKIKENENYTDTTCLFCLPISATDTNKISDTEDRIRKFMGFLVCKNLATKLDLPFETEWVLTTKRFISQVEAAAEGNSKSTEIFNLTGQLSILSYDLAKIKTPPEKINYKKEEITTESITNTTIPYTYKLNDQPN